MQMHAAGADAQTIRTAIESKYRSQYPNMTPTPPVRSEDGKRKTGR